MPRISPLEAQSSDPSVVVDPEQVRLQLERILASPPFRSSARCQNLLRYITEHTLAGDTPRLKERVLGAEVFGREVDYDTSQNPVVRATAGEIRKKLAQYYQEPERATELRISLPSGRYIPEFHPVVPAPVAPPAAPAPAPAPPRQWVRNATITGVTTAALVAALVFAIPRWTRSKVDQFWGPMLDLPGSVLFCIGQPRVYSFRSDQRQSEVEAMTERSPNDKLASAQELIPLNQLVPMWDRYADLSDTIALVHMTSYFERRGKAYSIRGGASTRFSDLRERPAVLIGAFDNDWTLNMVGSLRYTFYRDPSRTVQYVRDRDHPKNTDWKLTNVWPSWEMPNDYAIVSRVIDPTTDRMVVIAAGLTHFGTMAAGEFLTNADYFAEAVQKFPPGWKKKNLQIVLSVPVVRGGSGRPRVLATHVW